MLFFLYHFAGVPWSDAPYSYHLVPADRRPEPTILPTPASRLVLQVVLLDAGTGVVRVLRLVSLSPAFSRSLAAAVQEQAAEAWPGRAAWDARIAAAYRRFPSTVGLLAVASARTQGGE